MADPARLPEALNGVSRSRKCRYRRHGKFPRRNTYPDPRADDRIKHVFKAFKLP